MHFPLLILVSLGGVHSELSPSIRYTFGPVPVGSSCPSRSPSRAYSTRLPTTTSSPTAAAGPREHIFYLFGMETTLEGMAIVTFVIYGAILVMLVYYITYLRNKWAEEAKIRLDVDYSKHDAVDSSHNNSMHSLVPSSHRGGQLGSLADAKTPPRPSRRTQLVLPKRQPKAVPISANMGEEEDML